MEPASRIRIFLASPSDVASERDHVRKVVSEVNQTVGRDKGIYLEVISWEQDTYPAIGGDPQAIVNEQIAEMAKYDLFVGIMWNRIGSKTPRADSGTVEEFELALKAQALTGQPEVVFYFSEAPASIETLDDLEQRGNVIAFRDRLRLEGLPRNYAGSDSFNGQFHHDLLVWLAKVTAETPEAPSTSSSVATTVKQQYQPSSLRADLAEGVNTSGAWILLSNTFFIAERVEHDPNGHVLVQVTPSDAEEEATLRSLQIGQPQKQQIPYAYQNEGSIAEVRSARMISEGGVTKWTFEIIPNIIQRNWIYSTMSFNGVTADQMAERRARLLLLDEKPPKSEFDDLMIANAVANQGGIIRQESGIFPELWKRFQSNQELFLPLARLFAVFHLLASDTVEHIVELKLGPIKDNQIKVHFRGRRKKAYVNVPAADVEVDGACKLA